MLCANPPLTVSELKRFRQYRAFIIRDIIIAFSPLPQVCVRARGDGTERILHTLLVKPAIYVNAALTCTINKYTRHVRAAYSIMCNDSSGVMCTGHKRLGDDGKPTARPPYMCINCARILQSVHTGMYILYLYACRGPWMCKLYPRFAESRKNANRTGGGTICRSKFHYHIFYSFTSCTRSTCVRFSAYTAILITLDYYYA